jgi:cytochrome P450
MIDYDPFSMEAMSDPLPIYRQLRDHHPVYRLEQYGAWALARFDDVWHVDQDSEHFSILEGPIFDRDAITGSNAGVAPTPPSGPVTSFSALDPPQHTVLRRGVVPPLLPQSVGRLEGWIRERAQERLAQLIPQGRFDANRDYAAPVSAAVMCRLAGFPVDDGPLVQQLVNRGMARRPPGMTPEGQGARTELAARVSALVSQRRRQEAPAGTLIDGLLHLDLNGRRLTDEEIGMQVRTVISGGAETIPKVVAGGLLELWRRPDQRASVAESESNCGRAFEEMIRYGAPLQWVGRTLLCDHEVAGVPMRTGERVLLLLASANRDEREFDDPDDFRWDREIRRHLAFGQGLHFCIGSHLARLEGRVLLYELLQRLPEYEIDEASAVRPPSDFQVGYTSMPVVVA